MKKLLIILTVLFSVFLFTDKVCAEDAVTFPENMFDYIHMINTKDMSNDEVISMMTEKGFSEDYINGYLNFKNHINTYQQEDKYYFFAPGSGSSLYSSRLYINLTSNGLLAYFGIHYYDNYVYPLLNVRVSDSNKIYYTITSTSDYTIKTVSSAQWVTKVRATNEYLYENDLKEVYYFYETNMEIPISYSSDTGNYTGDLIINNETYALNSTLPYNTLTGVNMAPSIKIEEIDSSYVNVNSPLEGQSFKTSATYNISFSIYDESLYNYYYSSDNINWLSIHNNYELKIKKNGTYYFKITDKENNLVSSTPLDIVTLKPLDYVKVKFDVSNLEENGYTLDYIAITQNVSSDLKTPYYEVLYENSNLTYFNEKFESIESPNITVDLSNYKNIKYYNFVIDLKNYYDDLDFIFSNNGSHNFEIVYYLNDGQVFTTALEEYVSTIPEDYDFITIDLKDKSGIELYPKLVDTNGDLSNYYNNILYSDRFYPVYLSNSFKLYGYKVYIYDYVADSKSYKLTESVTKFNNYYDLYLSAFLHETYLKIEVPESGRTNHNYITFDSNLYSYKIIENDKDDVIISHPVTGDDINTGSLNDSKLEDELLNGAVSEDNEKNNNTFFGLFINAFNYFVEPISLFLSLIKSFFEVLPLGIQYMFYVSFGFLIALIIYKFII